MAPSRARPTAPLALALAALTIGLTSCITAQRLTRDRGQGEVRCYRGSFEEIWRATTRAVAWVGLIVEAADTAQGELLARNYELEVRDPEDMALDADAGERVGVFLDSAGTSLWAVEVLSRRVFALDVSARDWTPTVFAALEDQLTESARTRTREVTECELRRSGSSRSPSPPPGAQPPGTASGSWGRQSVTSNSSRSTVPSGLSLVGGASLEFRILRLPRPLASEPSARAAASYSDLE